MMFLAKTHGYPKQKWKIKMTKTRMWLKWDVIIKGVYCNRILKIFYFPLNCSQIWPTISLLEDRQTCGCITKLKKKTLHWYLTPIIETTESIPATRSGRIYRRASLIYSDWRTLGELSYFVIDPALSSSSICPDSSCCHRHFVAQFRQSFIMRSWWSVW
jgi:hypothetical protein